MKNDYPILTLCAHLEVSPSGYYGWQMRRGTTGPRAVANQTLTQQGAAIHAQSRQTYGSPRIVATLRQLGCHHGRTRIARLMKQAGLCGRQKVRFRVQTTDSHHDQPTAPNQLWVDDITYVETQVGWLYLAGILDLFSRKIVGWASERPAVRGIVNLCRLVGARDLTAAAGRHGHERRRPRDNQWRP